MEKVYSKQWILALELQLQACDQLVEVQLRQIRPKSGDKVLTAKSTAQHRGGKEKLKMVVGKGVSTNNIQHQGRNFDESWRLGRYLVSPSKDRISANASGLVLHYAIF